MKVIFCIISLLFPLVIHAQEATPIIPDTPPSPQAEAFNRLGNYEVNNNYGVPNINIPLFEIDFHGYKIPLSLQYEATPIKPGYNYDVTGLGWTLSGNSCVSRTIKDRADEYGLFSNSFQLDPFTHSTGQPLLYLDHVYNNILDKVNYQYDSYNVVLPSGRSIPFFLYKQNGIMICHTMPQDSKVKISCNYSTMNSFTVIDENGITYQFTQPEKASNILQDDPNVDYYVSWLLTSISIPGKGNIYYHYTENPIAIQSHNIIEEPSVTIKRFYDRWGEWPGNEEFDVRTNFTQHSPRYEMRLLKGITYDSSNIVFNYTEDNRHMKEIIVSDNDSLLRKFNLNVYSSSSEWFLNSLEITGTNNEDKLVYGFSYSGKNPGNTTDYWGNFCNLETGDNSFPYEFQHPRGVGNFNMYFGYEGIGWGWDELKSRMIQRGYLARLIENDGGGHSYYYKLKLQVNTGGDSRIPTPPNQHGVLERITYPNGGCTVFNYENHRFPTATAANGDIIQDRRNQRIVEGGGFRIESIQNFSADGRLVNEDYYRYGYTLGDIMQRNFPIPLNDSTCIAALASNDTINHHIGCGEAVVDPNLFTCISNFSYSILADQNSNTYSYGSPSDFRNMLLGRESRFENITNPQGLPTWWEATFSANNFRSLIGSRRPVVYPEITVYHGHPYEGCKSKTVYKYDIYKHQYPDYTARSNYLSNLGIAVADTAYFEDLYFEPAYPALTCCEYPSDRHLLKSKTEYSFNSDSCRWEIVNEEKYRYKKYSTRVYGYKFESIISRENYYPNTENLSYGQTGFYHPLLGVPLRDFYKPTRQYLGKSELCEKSTTVLREGRTPSIANTITESYEYQYPDILKTNMAYSLYNTKGTGISYIGDEENEDPVITEMKSRNMLASVVSTTTYADNNGNDPLSISGNKIEYGFYGNNIFPSKLYEYNPRNRYHTEDSPIDSSEYEESLEVISYDQYGNPEEIVDLKTGMHTVYLWEPYGRHMTAMIKDATMDQVTAEVLQSTGDSAARHAALQELFPNSLIQTWDYEPLVGVKSFTDINGSTLTCEYDGLGRLKAEKRSVKKDEPRVTTDGEPSEPIHETIKEYEYNYLNQ